MEFSNKIGLRVNTVNMLVYVFVILMLLTTGAELHPAPTIIEIKILLDTLNKLDKT